jgi:hypothetical protein
MYGATEITDARLDKWKPILQADPLFTTLVDKTAAGVNRLEGWLNAIMYQEKLFNYAFRLYDPASGDMEYFRDVVRFCNFGYIPSGAGSSAAKSKLNLILDLDAESGITKDNLNLFKEIFTNSFIYSLAVIINMLKENPEQIKTEEKALARYFTSNVKANAWAITGLNMKDGFFLDQGGNDFNTLFGKKDTEYEFFSVFIQQLKALRGGAGTYDVRVSKLLDSMFQSIGTNPVSAYKTWSMRVWPTLAACIAYLHSEDKANEILSLVQKIAYSRPEDDTKLFSTFPNQPDKDLQNIESDNKLNYYTIMRKLVIGAYAPPRKGLIPDNSAHIAGDALLQYILHLTKRVVEYNGAKKDADGSLIPTFTEVSASKFFKGP